MCVAPTYEKFKPGPKGLLSRDSVHRVFPETSGTVKKTCEKMGLLFLQFTQIFCWRKKAMCQEPLGALRGVDSILDQQ